MARNTVKLVLMDDSDRMLLIQGRDPASGEHHWYPVGGGVETGEDLGVAAAREAWEETGLDGLSGGVPVWVRDAIYDYAGRTVEVHEDWLFYRVQHFDPAPASLSDFEKLTVRQFRWWSVQELLDTDESVYPPFLGTHLKGLLERLDELEGPDVPTSRDCLPVRLDALRAGDS